MIIDLKFTVNNTSDVYPEIAVYYNNKLIIEKIQLINCGNVDDPLAKTQTVSFQIDIDDSNKICDHFIKIQSLNILDKHKVNSDFGFQLRRTVIDKIELSYYNIGLASFNPVTDKYIETHLKSANKLNEIEFINEKKIHVIRGKWANYVNLTDGWLELKFQTPLYHWLVNNNFGSQLEILQY